MREKRSVEAELEKVEICICVSDFYNSYSSVIEFTKTGVHLHSADDC